MENKFILVVMTVVSFIAIILAATAFVRVQQFKDGTPPPVTATPTEIAIVLSPIAVNTPTPSPTDTSTPSPTNTPMPSPTTKPTNTATETAMPTPTHTPTVADTPTETPLPTDTPAPTMTPTTAPPSPTPPPPAEAVVIADSVELRTGPAADHYDVITTLPNGTPLNEIRPVVNNNAWLQVSPRLDAGEDLKGYVTTDPNYVRINTNLAEIPPIYEYGPKPLTPGWYETLALDALIEFTWEAAGLPLRENQVYSVILVRDDLTDAGACYHWQTTETTLSFKPKDYDCPAGDYHWGVGLATNMGQDEEGKIIWRDDSQSDERFPIGIGVPHSGKPSGSDSGGGGLRNDPNRPNN